MCTLDMIPTSCYTSAGRSTSCPEKLSTDLTSLGEGQDRLAIVVEFVVAEDGAVPGSSLFRALVHNSTKLAYNSLAAWLTGNDLFQERVKALGSSDRRFRPPRPCRSGSRLDDTNRAR